MKIIAIQLLNLSLVFTCLAQGVGYQQSPGHAGGLQSDSSIVVADDFVLTNSTEISLITWWGAYEDAPPGSDNFIIGLHADSGGQPGSLQPGFTVGSINRAPTGASAGPGFQEYLYTAILTTPFQAQGGVKYWLSIANPLPVGEHWQWELSSSSPSFGVQRFIGGVWQPHNIVSGTAFAVPGFPVPEPGFLVFGALGVGCPYLRLLGKRQVQ